jgi:hypothetical protein
MFEPIELPAASLAYARAIVLMERRIAPKCEACGYGADRQKCPMDLGGHCQAHAQDSYIAFDEVRRELTRLGGLNDIVSWRQRVPLNLLHDFSKTERALLLDLHDKGGKASSRAHDDRYSKLGCGSGGKAAIIQSSQGDRHHVALTERGKALIALWAEEKEVA